MISVGEADAVTTLPCGQGKASLTNLGEFHPKPASYACMYLVCCTAHRNPRSDPRRSMFEKREKKISADLHPIL
jgi:hypothetical protein